MNFSDIDLNAINESLKDIEANSNTGEDVPVGKYEVKIDKIELKSTQKGMPMGFIQFRIQSGEHKNKCLFYNQVLVGTDKKTGQPTAFGIHNFNKFLKSLDSRVDIKFVDFNQYENLLLDIAEAVYPLIYEIQYSRKKDFPVYEILGVFEDESIPF